MNIVDFPIVTPLTDVSGRLRELADKIDAGKSPGRIAIVVLVDEHDETSVLGYGDIGTSAEALGWMVRAMRGI
jgi:hypothetical protein